MSGAYRWRRLTTGHGQWRRTGQAAGYAALAASASLAVLDAPAAIIFGLGGMILVMVSVVLSAARAAVMAVLRNWMAEGRFATKIAIVGTGPAAEAMALRLRAVAGETVQLSGRYASDPGAAGLQSIRGNLDTLELDCKLRRLDAVVLPKAGPPPMRWWSGSRPTPKISTPCQTRLKARVLVARTAWQARPWSFCGNGR